MKKGQCYLIFDAEICCEVPLVSAILKRSLVDKHKNGKPESHNPNLWIDNPVNTIPPIHNSVFSIRGDSTLSQGLQIEQPEIEQNNSYKQDF